jgi:hypothetical protein
MNESAYSMPCPYCGEYPPGHKWAGEGVCPGSVDPKAATIVTGSTYFALEIQRLKALCARAADALEELLVDEQEALFELCPDWSTPRYGLIAELRKAAQ